MADRSVAAGAAEKKNVLMLTKQKLASRTLNMPIRAAAELGRGHNKLAG